MNPELFVMPTPLMVNANGEFAVIVNGLAPALKTMPLTSILAETETAVLSEGANVAVAVDLLGTLVGV